MRDEIVKLIIEVQQTLLQSETPGVKAMCCCLLTRFQNILDANPEPQWVPVSERLPDEYLEVLTFCNNETHVGFMQDGRWVRADGFVMRSVTHWHDIYEPEPPEVK